MTNAHIDTSKTCLEKAKKWIERHYENNFNKKLKMLRSLSSIYSNQSIDKQLKKKKEEIKLFLVDSLDSLTTSESKIIDDITDKFANDFAFGYDEYCLRALILLILKELEDL